jgi:predicted DNA-binding ArsR family transcriptional regulator
MKRIKVINEPSELVPVLRCVDSDLKRKVFLEVSKDWKTLDQVEDEFGAEGREALILFEKMKLVESMWQSGEDNKQVKAYHTYYMSFHINTSCNINEISDILYVAMMAEDKFVKIEAAILDLVDERGTYVGEVCEKTNLTQIMLKSFIKRSTKLDYRGHRVELVKD